MYVTCIDQLCVINMFQQKPCLSCSLHLWKLIAAVRQVQQFLLINLHLHFLHLQPELFSLTFRSWIQIDLGTYVYQCESTVYSSTGRPLKRLELVIFTYLFLYFHFCLDSGKNVYNQENFRSIKLFWVRWRWS